MTRRAVILLNLGGPDSLDGVEPFLVNLFSDVISLPWGKFGSRFLGQLMARRRKERSQQLYRDIGGKSPILAETKAQAAALQAFLGEAYKVHIAMRYSSPTIDEIKSELKDQDIVWDEFIVLPLFPQYSFATTRTCQIEWERDGQLKAETSFIQSYHDHPGYIAALRDIINHALSAHVADERCHILFSAHGLPQSYIRRGDVYQTQIEDTVRLVMDGLPHKHSLAYQSKVGPVKWLAPSIADEITALAKSGVAELAVVPIAFVSEHLETLQELDMVMSKHAKEVGITNYIRVPALGTDPMFIEALANIIYQRESYT